MKIQFLGTAAAEGVPAIFCDCKVCEYSKRAGGKNIRSRSQAIIDGEILIDFCPDTLWHINRFGINTSKIHTCLITHAHEDHLNTQELPLRRPGFANLKNPFKMLICGSDRSMAGVIDTITEKNLSDVYETKILKDFETVSLGGYSVTALPAVHAPELAPFIYMLQKNGKTFIYGTDTGIFRDDVIDFLADKKIVPDAVALDCTMLFNDDGYMYHMTFKENVRMKEILINRGICTENTRFISHHFSHNGNSSYDGFVPVAKKHGFEVSYDGMTVNI